jgi:hypothetical protein
LPFAVIGGGGLGVLLDALIRAVGSYVVGNGNANLGVNSDAASSKIVAANESVQSLRNQERVVQRYTGCQDEQLVAAAMNRYSLSSGCLDHERGKLTNGTITFHVPQTVIGGLEVV